MDGAPQGALLTVTVGGQERTLEVQPTVFSRRSTEALCRLYSATMRDRAWNAMAALGRSALRDEDQVQIRQEYVSILRKCLMPGLQEALECMQTPEGLVVALQQNAGLSEQEAQEAVNGASNLMGIFRVLSEAGVAEISAAKN